MSAVGGLRSAAPLLLLAAALPAQASAPLLRLESVDARRCAEHQTVRVSFVELELEGRWRPFAAADYRLVVDGIALGSPPVAPRAFADTDEPLSVGLVVQVNLAWQRDMPQILGALEAFLGQLPPRTKVWTWSYGDTVTALGAAALPARAAEQLGAVRPSDSAHAASRQAIRAALDAMNGLPGRAVVVVLSDGLDDAPSRDEVRALGNLARARRVPVLPIAYSPKDERQPFLDLAELARRSSGLFRWAEDLDDVGPELTGLADSLSKSWVVDYAMPEPCARSHEVEILRGELRSEAMTILAQEQRRKVPWVAIGVVAAVALIAVVVAAGLLVTRKRG